MPSPKALLARARERSPLLDHLVRALGRYQSDAGDRLAAAVTFYWFLSLFPLLLLAVAVLGVVYDDPAKDLSVELAKVLPTDVARTLEEVITSNTGRTGLIGVAGLLLSGLGWVEALRQAIRTMWRHGLVEANLVVKKLIDVVVLVGLFATLAASVLLTGLVTAFTDTALGLVGIDAEAGAAQVGTRLLGYGVALVVDTGVFLYVLTGLVGVRSPVRSVLPAAVFGAVGFEVLKVLGGLYVERTTSKGEATYGAFAVVIGLLLFLNLVSRLIILTAAFAVTGPGDSDSAPSGSSGGAPAEGVPDDLPALPPQAPPAAALVAAAAPLAVPVQADHREEHGESPGRASVVATPVPRAVASAGIGAAGGVLVVGLLLGLARAGAWVLARVRR